MILGRRSRQTTIGWFGSDVVDWIGDRASDAADVFTSIAGKIPFAPELAGALQDVVNGPLRDFANTPYGLVVLRALSTTVYGPIAWTIGPQLASFAFAFPGVARGDDFWTAYATEVKWRAEKTAETLGPGVSAAVTPKVQEAVTALAGMLPSEVRQLAIGELAKRLNVDDWTAAMARWFIAQIPMPPREDFDPVTGKFLAALGRRSGTADTSSPGSLNACEALAAYRGTSETIRAALKKKCADEQRWGFEANRGNTTSYAAVLASRETPVASAGAVPVVVTASRRNHDLMLAVVIVAAAGTFAWWHSTQGKKR